jgi:hypothetical protein
MKSVHVFLASLLFFMSPLFSHAGMMLDPPPPPPPTLDLSDWRQLDILDVFGNQWPGGVNPDYKDWDPPEDGRAFLIKAVDLSITREETSGDPPTTHSYNSFTSIAFEYWIGDDLNLHYFGYYKYEDSTGKVVDETFIATLFVQPGQSPQELFQQLKDTSLPTELSAYQDVEYATVPEPHSALLFAGGMGIIGLIKARRGRPNATGRRSERSHGLSPSVESMI